ncbi:MAG: 3-hydroxyacyl-ACP dehydratase FabZ family protein [Candidatus Ancaeobacter aquaticus]|nr:3-hydroxyacyl-ACP dehydratase FabZ family protein [Candidatus Ancaeobacter aquaticus]
MKFTLIDKIIAIEDNKKITAVKNLSLSEEYLMDHFPGNPVMPGVLMLEAMVQTGGWLVRLIKDFKVSIVVLGEARNIKYSRFITPGDQLRLELELLDMTDDTARFKGVGYHNDKPIVNGRISLKYFNLTKYNPLNDINDSIMQAAAKEKFKVLYSKYEHK